jgi:two-component system chemotaxis sensor kinase CheA
VLGFATVEAVGHLGEDIMSPVRDGNATMTRNATTALLALSDRLREELISIDTSGGETGAGYVDLAAIVQELVHAADKAPPATPKQKGASRGKRKKRRPKRKPVDKKKSVTRGRTSSGGPRPGDVGPAAESSFPGPARLGEVLMQRGLANAEDIAAALEAQRGGDDRSLGKILVAEGVVSRADIDESLAAQKAGVTDSSIHVRVDVLDGLINLVGELVLVRNRMLSLPVFESASTGRSAAQRLNAVVSRLQETVMKTRMQPIGRLWGKMPRLARDLALSCGKEVALDMEGGDTEVDKTVLESVSAALTHLVRNAVDHGVESPEARMAADKPPTGQVRLRASHVSGQVAISVSDDGAGIDPDLLRRSAVAKGLLTEQDAATLDERRTLDLIFMPGFSTAGEVGKVSGRGVGMDVVKTNIARLGGSIQISSERGAGTTIELRIPLTLTIIPALVVSLCGQRYAFPQTSVVELIRAGVSGKSASIERVHGAPVLRRRGRLIPVVLLTEVFGLTGRALEGGPTAGRNMVVLQAYEKTFAVVVDGVLDAQEIVVKPLDKRIGRIPVFFGSTVMGDGRAALIVDAAGLAQTARVVSDTKEDVDRRDEAEAPASERRTRPVLLMRGADDGRLVLDLSVVQHLARIHHDRIEHARGRDLLQFQGDVLPLMDVSDLLLERRGVPRSEPAADPPAERDTSHVVVCADGARVVGLLVDEVLDILESPPGEMAGETREGVRGTMVLDGRICEILDTERLFAAGALKEPVEGGATAGGEA